ncbi:hypothetical protein [Burkholderia cenocepacia]|uniref:hypothetical protein n=1 Tax=Burkholderia cenocepacia TaxID=95486 RepID=UPI001B9266DA|nr:hypothetical protein [Burkholderia cenocepacia]MBR8135134.1 hypothetical protein [Burkholderia cenocepacia]
MLKLPIVITMVVLLTACTSKGDAEWSLRGYPIHDVKIGGYAPFVCDGAKRMGRRYSATDNKTGAHVEGVLCVNLFNNITEITEVEQSK